jgi:hypothetical protein
MVAFFDTAFKEEDLAYNYNIWGKITFAVVPRASQVVEQACLHKHREAGCSPQPVEIKQIVINMEKAGLPVIPTLDVRIECRAQ